MLRVTRTALFFIGMALVRRHQRPQVGAVGRSGTGNVVGVADLVEGGGDDVGGPAPRDAEPDETGPADDDQGQGQVAGPVGERPGPDEQGGGDRLPDDVLEGQFAGDPGGREGQDGTGLVPDGAVGHEDGEAADHGDGQEGVGHGVHHRRSPGTGAAGGAAGGAEKGGAQVAPPTVAADN